ncbi:MAG: CdaR family protein [Chloroflexota bacterium]
MSEGKMLHWLTKNLRTVVLAFALALAVWISAVTAADPDETRLLTNSIPIEFVSQDPGLIIKGQVPRQVQITLRAPRSVWDKLTTEKDAIHALVDLSGLEAGTHRLDVQVQINARPVRLISFSPEKLDLTLEKLVTRSLPLELTLTGEPAIGYQAGDPILNPAEVIISGAQSLMNQVAHLSLLLDLSDSRQDIQTTLPIKALDDKGNLVTGLTMHPDNVQVSLPISQQGGYRDLAVKVVTIGRPANGYRLTNIAPIPPVVTVFSSNLELISALPGYVETTPLDLNGASADIEIRLNLNLPAGVALVGEPNVLVQVGILAIQSSLKLTNRPVEINNLSATLQANVSPDKVDVILSGPLPVLDTLAPSDVHVVIDVKGLGVGTHHLTPTIQMVIEGVTVVSILPGTVEVIISYK